MECNLSIGLIDPNPFQTRTTFNEEKIAELAESVKAVGLLNRILVRPHPEEPERFQLVHGERRLRACKTLGWKEIPAVVRELNDQQLAEMSLVENLQREDLNPIEEARGYQVLIDRFGYTKKSLADKVGKSRPYISNSIRLLKMDYFLKCCVLCKTISVWHARIIMGLPEGYTHYVMADLVMDWALSVAETRNAVKDVKAGETWIKWIRDVPLLGLIPYSKLQRIWLDLSRDEFQALIRSMRAQGQLSPISVLVTGHILDGHQRVKAAEKLGWKTIRAEVMYKADWMKRENKSRASPPKSSEVKEGRPKPSGIIPEPTEEQLKRVKNLCLILKATYIQILVEEAQTLQLEAQNPPSSEHVRERLGWSQREFNYVLKDALQYKAIFEPKPGHLRVSR